MSEVVQRVNRMLPAQKNLLIERLRQYVGMPQSSNLSAILIAYYSMSKDSNFNSSGNDEIGKIIPGVEEQLLRDHVTRQLPDYMCPVHFVALEYLPRMSNGKLNLDSLPIVAKSHKPQRDSTIEPDSTLSIVMHEIGQLLALDDVRADDSFFDLGGDSITAIQLCARIEEQVGVRLSLRNLLDSPTLHAIATFLDSVSSLQQQNGEATDLDSVEYGEI